MNKFLTLSAAAALILSSSISSAAVFSDLNEYDRVIIGINSGSGRLPSFTDEFDITADGYTPLDEISSAWVQFNVQDENRNEGDIETFRVELDNLVFDDNFGGTLPFAVVSFGGNLLANLIVELESDGRLSYTIEATAGDFRLKSAYLEATTVPDGGMTVGTLGLGLLAIAGIRRKMMRG